MRHKRMKEKRQKFVEVLKIALFCLLSRLWLKHKQNTDRRLLFSPLFQSCVTCILQWTSALLYTNLFSSSVYIWLLIILPWIALCCVIKAQILGLPFILASLWLTWAIIMLLNQNLYTRHLWSRWITCAKKKCLWILI